jgi:outer membrane protein OmpA-like peptidoglycan-associated protein
MRSRILLTAGALTTALGALASASAQSAPELPVDVQILEMVNLPQEAPRLALHANEGVEGVNVVVREGNARVAARGFGRLAAGSERVLTWRAQPGVHNYVVQVSGRSARGSASVAVESVVTVMRPLEVQLRREQVDLEERVLHFAINNPAGRATLTVHNDAGRVIHEATTDYRGRPPGARLELRWPELGEPIRRMQLRVYDASDSWSDFELLPFSVEIPHEDVVFETARSEIRASEAPKLETAYDAILEAIREHGADLKARLYILGHTDTVGSPGDNQQLSQRRAAAIARWFMDRGGITLPILAQGFGETRLLVPTADNTDEARNRRAQYILAAQAPAATNWTVISQGK